jgi:hypothetical protein
VAATSTVRVGYIKQLYFCSKLIMTFKVTFENNVPLQAVEAKDGVVQKKYTIDNGITTYDWILVSAETGTAALAKAKEVENKVNED